MSASSELILLVHLAATSAMVGLIWFVQITHYPLLAVLEGQGARAVHRFHVERAGLVIVPLMLTEAVSAIVLVVLLGGGTQAALAWTGAGLLAVIWVSTFLVQVPLHRKLTDGSGGRERQADSLVRTNWIRTVCWSVRGCIALLLTAGALYA